MPTTLRLSDREIIPSFLEWATNQRDCGARLICVEGLPGAGKSRLLKGSLDADFRGIELDCLLRQTACHTTSWVEQVKAGGAIQSIRAALDSCDCVLVDGPAVWPLVMPVVEDLGQSAVRRVYLKRMSIGGGVIEWLEGEGLLDHAARSNAYWQSIYEHHGSDRPWLSADLIIERVPEE